jgi:hypothetical protein
MNIGRKPEVSLGLALATGAVVYGTYTHFVPNQSNLRVGKPGDEVAEKTRKQAAWFSAAIVGGISLLAKDAAIFIVGGGMIVALDWAARSNNWTNPLSGRVDINPLTVESVPQRDNMPTADIDTGGYAGLSAVN